MEGKKKSGEKDDWEEKETKRNSRKSKGKKILNVVAKGGSGGGSGEQPWVVLHYCEEKPQRPP